VIEGAGHEIQFTGAPVNRALLALWRQAGQAGPTLLSSGMVCLDAAGLAMLSSPA
jgi:hypothetical protein